MKRYAIIVAGGKGVRMGKALPKQFLELDGIPVILHTLNVFYRFDPTIQLIVVLPGSYFGTWKTLCDTCSVKYEAFLAEGGPERFHSVKSGLKFVDDDKSVVAVHDAVRPLVSREVLDRAFTDAEHYGNAIPVIPVNESLRERTGVGSRSVDRKNLFMVQTPQCFRTSILKKAYRQNYASEFTDDATVVESDGEIIHLVEGNPENIKITSPADMLIAEALLRHRE